MAEPLVTVGPGNEFEAGIYPSVDKLSAPFWTDGENVEFRKGGISSSKGYTSLATLPGTADELAQAYHEGDQRIYAAVGPDVYMRSSLTGLSALGTFPSEGDVYFETLGSFLLAANGVDPIRAWENTGTLDEISEAAARFDFAKLLHRRANHIIAFNTSNGQNAYEWCDRQDIHLWEPAANNTAGSNFIRDLDSDIVSVVDIGQQTAVYSRETMALLRFVGVENGVFGHDQAINGVGAVGPHSTIQVGSENWGLNRQGIFVTDGVGFRYADEPAIHDYLVNTIDFDLGASIRGYHNEDLSSVIWFFTKIGGGRAGIGYNYARPGFRKYAMNVEAVIERQVFSYPIASVGDALVQLNVGHDANGAALTKWVRSKPMAAGDASFWKSFSHIKSVGQWNDADLRIGLLEDPNSDDIEWLSTQDLAYENWFDRDSVFLVLEFRAENVGAYFEVSQLQVHGVRAGKVSA